MITFYYPHCPALGLAGAVSEKWWWAVVGNWWPPARLSRSRQAITISHQQAVGYDNAIGHGDAIEETFGSSTVYTGALHEHWLDYVGLARCQ